MYSVARSQSDSNIHVFILPVARYEKHHSINHELRETSHGISRSAMARDPKCNFAKYHIDSRHRHKTSDIAALTSA